MFRILTALALATVLAVAGLPASAAAPEPPPVEAYGRLPALGNVTLSPSGERLAFVASTPEGRKLFVRTVGGQPLAMMPLESSKVRSVYWGGERYVVFTVTVTRKLFLTLPPIEVLTAFSLDLQTNKLTPLPARANKSWDVLFRNYGVAEVNGRWVAFFSTFEQRQTLAREMIPVDYTPDLFSIDLETGEVTLINRGETSTSDWLLDGGRVVAREIYVDKTGAWKVTAGEGGDVLASGSEMLGEAGMIGLGRAPGTFLLSAWAETGRNGFKELSLTNGAQSAPFIETGDLIGPVQDRMSGLLIGILLARTVSGLIGARFGWHTT